MKLTNEFEPIREWASEKGIYRKGDVKTQFIKLLEEVGELGKAILKEDPEEFKDAIGDCVVVLTSVAELANNSFCGKSFYEDVIGDGGLHLQQFKEGNLSIEECINSAYSVIKNRKGKMQNGTFVKINEE